MLSTFIGVFVVILSRKMSFEQKDFFDFIYKLARLNTTDSRLEKDAVGVVHVPCGSYFSAHTVRALMRHSVGGMEERMPKPIIQAMGFVKKAAAQVNLEFGLKSDLSQAIANAADDVISGKLYDEEHFPLVIWQGGSGSQTDMNVNEVICNLAIESLGGQIGSNVPVHPIQHVNMNQSPNDVFASCANIAIVNELVKRLVPSLKALLASLKAKVSEFDDVIKIGRTHLMDAVPIKLGQVFSGYAQQISNDIKRVETALPRLYDLPLGSTTVGTGDDAPAGFGRKCIAKVSDLTGLPFVCAANPFESLAAYDSMIEVHGQLNTIAASLMKIANDMRLLGSGPRCGIGELQLPENELAGEHFIQDNWLPSQCECITMIAAQVMGNHVAITVGGSNGHFELNAFRPMIAANVLRSVVLLADGCLYFATSFLQNVKARKGKIAHHLNNSLMLAAALNPHIGYDMAAKIANAAHNNGTSLREEAIKANVSATDFDNWLRPEEMLGPT